MGDAVDERRTGFLLIFLLVIQFVLVAVQGARSSRSLTYAEKVGLHIIGPLARLVSLASHSAGDVGGKVRLQGRLLAENRELRRQVEELRLRLLTQGDVAEELARLGEAVRYSAPLIGQIRVVDVVYADYVSWLRSLLIYTGDRPATLNQPVLSAAGLVGRVVLVAGPYAKVQLITDRAASVGGMIQRTRHQGVVRGGQEGGALTFDYVPLSADVRPGDSILTAGIDGVYPRGVPVGTVVAVEPGGQLFHRIHLVPAVDLGSIDQVYLLEHAAVPQDLERAAPDARH